MFFDVDAGGNHYDELHVDGSVGTRVFYTAGVFSFATVRGEAQRGSAREDIYIIHNGQLLPIPAVTNRSVFSIAYRVFDTAGKTAFLGDLFRIYTIAVREHADYHWITIPDGVELAGEELFDPVRMGGLYDVGYRNALAGPSWSTEPPGLSGQAPP